MRPPLNEQEMNQNVNLLDYLTKQQDQSSIQPPILLSPPLLLTIPRRQIHLENNLHSKRLIGDSQLDIFEYLF
jgi:hypothetical protein